MNKQAKLKQDQDVAKDDLTIILSYPHVYRFKPICYGMIVAVLNCHSSVITIMEKNDNILCINYTIKTGIIRKTKNQDFKNEKSKKTANDLLIAFIV